MSRVRGSFSIVVPVFNEQETLEYTHLRLLDICNQNAIMRTFSSVEIIYVDDGSRDKSPELLEKFSKADPARVTTRFLQFSRNFGHSAAVLAGLEAAVGDRIAIIDADLQDPPEMIPEMCAKIDDGWDVVYGKRTARQQESLMKRFTAWIFYRLLNSLAGIEIPRDTGDFRVITREVRDALMNCREQEPFLRGLVAWVGFRQLPFSYVREGRKYGATKYPFRKMFRFASLALVSFSSVPLRLAIYLGAIGLLFTAAIGVWALITRLNGFTVPGWTSLLMGFSLGQSVTLLIIGMIGVYVGRIHSEAQGRPRYILRKGQI